MPHRFGKFEFDPTPGVLSREGIPVRLQPQPARVLALLIERAGEVVSRETLKTAVWDEGTYVDFERGLNFCIAQIRGALGDAADSPRFVETVPRRGYRFIAPVARVGTSGEAHVDAVSRQATAEASATPAIDSRHRSRRWLAAAAVLVTAAGLAALFEAGGTSNRPVRVAVVPFDNETGNPAYQGLAEGIADATVARLAAPERVTNLAVIGNSAALRQPRSFRDLKAVGERVGAEYVVLAQIKRDDTEVRLIAHLIRVSDEAHVWAQTFDRPAFTLDVQAEVAEAIASAVASRLAPR